jgi:hypothetical protein
MPIPWDLVLSNIDLATVVASAAVAVLLAGFASRITRLLAIWIGQYTAFVGLVLAVAVGGRVGYVMGGVMAKENNFNQVGQLYCSIAGAGIGGLLGFAAGALALSVFFVLFEVAANTRK